MQRSISIIEQSEDVIIDFKELQSHRFKSLYWMMIPKTDLVTVACVMNDWMEHKDIEHPSLTISED